MITPNTLQELRRDGRVLDESTTPEQMLDAGVEPDKIIALRWDDGGRAVELRTPYGFLAQTVPNRQYVAVLEESDATGDHSVLSVYASSGALVHSFRNVVQIGEVWEVGEFLWFEEPVSDLPTAFSPVFNVARTGGTFQVDFDAVSGGILSILEVR